jgi:hypothetical protein
LAVKAVPEERDVPLDALVQGWLRDLRVLGRSPRTIRWYEQKMVWFLKQTGLETLDELGAPELKGYLAWMKTPTGSSDCWRTPRSGADSSIVEDW